MTWAKIGFFPVPQGVGPWSASHCQLPTALPLGGDRVRVFYATRDTSQRSHVGYADLRVEGHGFAVEDVAREPVLAPGPMGHFDEHGVFPSCVIRRDGRHLMYFIGWNRGVEAPLFYAAIGLAVSEDGKVFKRVSPAPILARSEFDPCLVTSPHVYLDDGRWFMSYVSGTAWTRNADGRLQSHYHIKLAESADGIAWERQGKVAIDFKPGETNIARSAVQKLRVGGYRMWFSFVDRSVGRYRMGYAESTDGRAWKRRDELAGIGLDDSHARKMICYPSVFELSSGTYMAYNGDNYGQAGFGLARLDVPREER